MKIKTADLIGLALDWAVAKCEWGNKFSNSTDLVQVARRQGYSTNWGQGGPIIEREKIAVDWDHDCWNASKYGHPAYYSPAYYSAPTPLIAAMRCFVASRFGDEVDIPEELL